MLQQLLNHSPDIRRLQSEGYEIDLQGSYLLIHSIPYLNSKKEICKGILISSLILSGDKTAYTNNNNGHVVLFDGDYPCNKDGSEIAGIKLSANNIKITDKIHAKYSFSNKPQEGYKDYFDKMNRYADIISAPVKSINKQITAKTYKTLILTNEKSVFKYMDTNSSRANINSLSDKLKNHKIGIIGLGGTGSYILDFVAKTPVSEIHLFDGDDFLQHNAFRAPGAPSFDNLNKSMKKVDYFAMKYSNMRENIYPHSEYIDESNIDKLKGLDFVFVCLDNGSVKSKIFPFFELNKIPFIDVGMGLYLRSDMLDGTLRTTGINPGNESWISKLIDCHDEEDNAYSTNIQIAELNAMNACFAVIMWKKKIGFYASNGKLLNYNYSISVNNITTRGIDENEV